jgi:two-component system chemotaxis response regulator CheB
LHGAIRRPDVIAMGASAGGTGAVARVLAGLPAQFAVPVVLVVHMPRAFTRALAMRLSAQTGVCVREAHAGAEAGPGEALLAPGGVHLEVRRAGSRVRAVLGHGAAELSCRPSINVLFRSVAAAYGDRALGVVLTGMGEDGLAGSRALRHAGSRVIAQDAATSLVWGMPGSVARAGLADRVLPLGRIAEAIARSTGAGAVFHG